jgi:hypothetical protein
MNAATPKEPRKVLARHECYIVDADGHRLSVILGFDQYQELLVRLEELEEIYAFDLAEDANDEAIPLEQALNEIEQARS